MRKQFLKNYDLLPINGKWKIKENEKPIPYALTLASLFNGQKNLKNKNKPIPYRLILAFNQWQKENEVE